MLSYVLYWKFCAEHCVLKSLIIICSTLFIKTFKMTFSCLRCDGWYSIIIVFFSTLDLNSLCWQFSNENCSSWHFVLNLLCQNRELFSWILTLTYIRIFQVVLLFNYYNRLLVSQAVLNTTFSNIVFMWERFETTHMPYHINHIFLYLWLLYITLSTLCPTYFVPVIRNYE